MVCSLFQLSKLTFCPFFTFNSARSSLYPTVRSSLSFEHRPGRRNLFTSSSVRSICSNRTGKVTVRSQNSKLLFLSKSLHSPSSVFNKKICSKISAFFSIVVFASTFTSMIHPPNNCLASESCSSELSSFQKTRAQNGASDAEKSNFDNVASKERISPPVPEKIPHQVKIGKVEGENRGVDPMDPPKIKIDPYYWMRDDDRKDEKVIAHIKAENDYTRYKTKHLDAFQQTIYQEMKGFVKETDTSAPYAINDRKKYLYFSKTTEGLSYSTYVRKDTSSGEETILLDVNVLAEDSKHMDVGDVSPSPSEDLLVYTMDTSGYETYQAVVKNILTGEVVDTLRDINSGVVWGVDDSTLYYTKLTMQTHRPYQLYRHKIGSSQENDVLLIQEDDEMFWAGVSKSRDGQYLFYSTSSKDSSEEHILDLNNPEAGLKLIAARQDNVEYSANVWENVLLIHNNDGERNFKLDAIKVVDIDGTRDKWTRLVNTEDNSKIIFGGSDSISLSGLSCFKNFVSVYGREDGLLRAWIIHPMRDDTECLPSFSEPQSITFPEDSYEFSESSNRVYDTSLLRLRYSSMITPPTIYDYDMKRNEFIVVKEQEVPGYDKELYSTMRFKAPSHDGTLVPMSIVYSKKVYPDGPKDNCPVYLYGYGSYGINIDPSFSHQILPLLNRGMVYCIANIRGGGEMGYFKWYQDQGKYLTKKNTFLDFIACAEYLINEKRMTSPQKLAIEGRSAGGLLMGAVLNMRPDLFKCVLAGVPFVDVVTTVADPSIPLSVVEWSEWGNPNNEKYFDYITSYSPMDNVKPAAYPSILVTAGLNDPRVPYWEPLKWVAKLRENKMNRDSELLLIKTDLDSGHFSASDRYKLMRERSFEYAFMLDRLGLAKDLNPEMKS